MFLTDQDRAIQHFPNSWARENLPGLTRLRRKPVGDDWAPSVAVRLRPLEPAGRRGEPSSKSGNERVLDYLASRAAQQQPFFLVVSLVNPHDVLMYPKNYIKRRLRRLLAGGQRPPAAHVG